MTLGNTPKVSAAIALFLSACTNIPSPNYVGKDGNEGSVTVGTLVHHIQCELHSANQFDKLAEQNYRAQVTLTLKVEDNAGLSPSLSFIQPYAVPSTSLTYAVGGTLNVNRQRIFTDQYTIDLAKLQHKFPKNDSDTSCPGGPSTSFNLTGDLGIGGIIAGGLEMAPYQDVNADAPSSAPSPQNFSFDGKIANRKEVTALFEGHAAQEVKRANPSPQPPSFGSTVQFTITKSINAGPNWILQHFKGPGGNTGVLGAGRIDTDTMIIAFAPGPKLATGEKLTQESIESQRQSEAQAQSQVQSLTTNMILQNLGALH